MRFGLRGRGEVGGLVVPLEMAGEVVVVVVGLATYSSSLVFHSEYGIIGVS